MIRFLFSSEALVFTVPALFSLVFWVAGVAGFRADDGGEADLEASVEIHPLLSAAGIGQVPVTIIITLLLFFFGWTGIGLHALFGEWLAGVGWSGLGRNALFVPAALVAAFGASAGLSRALHPLFREFGEPQKALDLVGKIAVLNSSTVTRGFGSAVVRMPGGERIEVAARASCDDNDLRYGDRTLVVDYDPQKNIYTIERLDEPLLLSDPPPDLV
jgi:hypothetical protein